MISPAQVYDFKSYTVREGLLSNAITSLCQDSYGYLWVGTGDGLSVYDGETFTNYTVADGLGSSLVNCIIEDRNERGIIWIGTNGGGVSRFHSGAFTSIRMGGTEWSNRVNSITQDKSGTLYCASDDGVYIVDQGVVSPIPGRFIHGTYSQVLCDGDSLLILDAQGRLEIFRLSDRETIDLTGKLGSHAVISRVCVDSRHEIWALFSDGALMDISRNSVYRGVAKSYPKFMLHDQEGNLWIGTPEGVFVFDRKSARWDPSAFISKENGLPENDVTAGLWDREGDLWIGTAARGLAKLADNYSYEFPAEDTHFSVDNTQAASDREGHLWVATDKGLLEIWNGNFGALMSRLHSNAGLGVNSRCVSVQVVSGDQLWLASLDGFVYHFVIAMKDEGSFVLRKISSFSMNGILPGKSILCLYIDNSGLAWYSRDLAGVFEFDTKSGPRSGKIYTTKDGLPDNSIRAIFRDSKGDIWFGGYIGGLARLRRDNRTGKMTLYTTKDGLPDNSVRSVAEDDSGKLWIGTRYGGVAVKSGHRFIPLSVKEGLLSNGVWATSYDAKYGILFGTQLGLQELEKGDWRSKHWRRYGDATPVYACGITRQPTARGQTDFLWACNSSGIFLSDLSHPLRASVPPLVYITGLLVNGKKVPLHSSVEEGDSGITLKYSENTLTFDFAGISLRDEGRLQYRYRLRGIDPEWRLLTRRLPVTYAALRPGRYGFDVKAVNTAGVESRNIATLPFAIVPPFWRRWWFVLFSAIALVAIIYFSIRFKVRRLLEIERVRARIATDLHDDIGSGLTRIAILADVALRQTAITSSTVGESGDTAEISPEGVFSTRGIVSKIGNNARDLVDSMSDVIWSIDPKNVTIGDLISRFRSFAYEICEAKGISLDVDIDREVEILRLDPGVMRTLLLIAKEALNNSVKHSGCSHVRVGIKATSRELRFLVSDDGTGFSTTEGHGGHGLVNMRERAAKLGGEFKLCSSPGTGTSIEITMPLGA